MTKGSPVNAYFFKYLCDISIFTCQNICCVYGEKILNRTCLNSRTCWKSWHRRVLQSCATVPVCPLEGDKSDVLPRLCSCFSGYHKEEESLLFFYMQFSLQPNCKSNLREHVLGNKDNLVAPLLDFLYIFFCLIVKLIRRIFCCRVLTELLLPLAVYSYISHFTFKTFDSTSLASALTRELRSASPCMPAPWFFCSSHPPSEGMLC